MPKPKPSGYVTAEETKKPGYLAKRMKMYRQMVEEAKRKQQENEAEAQAKTIKFKGKS